MAPLGRISWMGQVDAVLASVSDMLYSWGLMWLLIGAGVFFTVRTRGVQVRHTDAIAASVIGSRDGSHGGITSFQAVAVGLAAGLRGTQLLVPVVTAALPTAQNVFMYASRYGAAKDLARDAVLLTTAGFVPVVLLAAALLH